LVKYTAQNGWKVYNIATSDLPPPPDNYQDWDTGALDVINSNNLDAYLAIGGPSYSRGGELQKWSSYNGGVTWQKVEDITSNSNGLNNNPQVVVDYTNELKVVWAYVSVGDTTASIIKSYPVKLLFSTTTPPTRYRIAGRLVNITNSPVQGKIIIYQQGTNTVVNSTQTNPNGDYSLSVITGTYDVQFNLTNFYIPNYFIRLPSVDVTSDVSDLVKYITGDISGNRVAIAIDIRNPKIIQTYSNTKPARVLINSTVMTEFASLSNLPINSWFYNSTEQKLYMYA
jgi:hypothetical protein